MREDARLDAEMQLGGCSSTIGNLANGKGAEKHGAIEMCASRHC